jgi:aspartyl-tRNA(Asn)/glutamyl-tRNA(Gln) amidotransferase subunit A
VADLRNALGKSVEGMTIGMPAEYFATDVHPGIAAACRAALDRLQAAGAKVRPVSLPGTAHALAALHVIAAAEAFSSLARFDGVRFGTRAPRAATAAAVWEQTRAMFGAEAKRSILLGAMVLSAAGRDRWLRRAEAARARIAGEFARVFAEGVDAVFTPTSPVLPWRAGESADAGARSHAFTAGASLAGLPAISLPVGTADGLPVGGQLIGAAWTEARLVRVADALERALTPAPSAAVPAAI